jgi:predicted DNA-binding protein
MSNEVKVSVGARICPQWRDELEAIAAATNRPLGQIVGEAIGQYLNHQPDSNSLPVQVESLKTRVNQLEQKLQGLTLLLGK